MVDPRTRLVCGEAGTRPDRPFFSVIVPVWNRSNSVRRCIDSVLSQTCGDYEIIAVDDGSEDDSVAVLHGCQDRRLRVIEHAVNQGVCAARRTAVQAAAGQWIVALDSDWALLPGALGRLAELAKQAAGDVGVIGAMARTDQEAVWPSAPLPEGSSDFVDYLRWWNQSEATDFLHCYRRGVFDRLNWPGDRGLESQFNLRVAKAWNTLFVAEILAIAYTDCLNRYTTDTSPRAMERRRRDAADLARQNMEIFSEFAPELRRYCPKVYLNLCLGGALHSFQAGMRLNGLRCSLRALARRPWALGFVGLAVVGVIGPDALAALRQFRARRSASQQAARPGRMRGAPENVASSSLPPARRAPGSDRDDGGVE